MHKQPPFTISLHCSIFNLARGPASDGVIISKRRIKQAIFRSLLTGTYIMIYLKDIQLTVRRARPSRRYIVGGIASYQLRRRAYLPSTAIKPNRRHRGSLPKKPNHHLRRNSSFIRVFRRKLSGRKSNLDFEFEFYGTKL